MFTNWVAVIGDETEQTRGNGEAVKSLSTTPSPGGANYAGNIGTGWQSFGLTAWQLLVVRSRVRQTIR